MTREISNRNKSTSSGDASDDDGSGNHNSNSSQSNNSSANSHAYWSIVNEVGDGACLLKCIARHVFDNSLLHFIGRHQLLAHMSEHMHDVVPGSGGNTFHQVITSGINEEYIKIYGFPQNTVPKR